MTHVERGGWDIGTASFNLRPQAVPQRGTPAEDEDWYPGARLRRPNTLTDKWRERTVR